jgi:DNA excision repair protein ERCC-2
MQTDAFRLEVPNGIYSLDDMKELGNQRGWCPYFMTRHLMHHANIVVYNYQYMLDPKVANLVSRELEAESIVVFDEAHNIDNVCIEALSVTLDTQHLGTSLRSVSKLQTRVQEMKASDNARLQREYADLVNGLADQGILARETTTADATLANPILSNDILQEAVPGNIRKAEHFVTFLKKVSVYRETSINGTTEQSSYICRL